MKKRFLIKNIICTAAAALALASMAYAKEADVYVNGIKTESVSPQYKDEMTLAPIRTIATGIGAEVTWNENKIIVQKGDQTITFIPGIWKAYINGVEKRITYPVYIDNGTAYAEVNDLASVLSCKIVYSQEKNSYEVTLLGAQSQANAQSLEAPKLSIEDRDPNIFSYQIKSGGVTLDKITPYRAVWDNSEEVLNNIYRAQLEEKYRFSFEGAKPDSVTVKREELLEYSETEPEIYPSDVQVKDMGDYYEFIHETDTDESRIYIIDASWGSNTFEYMFVVDNVRVIEALEGVEEIIGKKDVVDYTIAGGYVYYISGKDKTEIHEMLLDGTEDCVIETFPSDERITGSTKITSEYDGEVIKYSLQETGIYGDKDDSEYSVPEKARNYELDLKTKDLRRIY